MYLVSQIEEIHEDSDALLEDNIEDNKSLDNIKPDHQKRKFYTIEDKLFFVKLLDNYSQHAISKEYNIIEKIYEDRKKQESELLQLKLKRFKRRIIGEKKSGVEPKTKDIEKDLVLL